MLKKCYCTRVCPTCINGGDIKSQLKNCRGELVRQKKKSSRKCLHKKKATNCRHKKHACFGHQTKGVGGHIFGSGLITSQLVPALTWHQILYGQKSSPDAV